MFCFVSSSLWHSRLGHASLPRVQSLASSGHLGRVDFDSFDCVSCQMGKQKALPFNNSASLSSAAFDLVHFDVWGPAPIPSQGGSCYFVIFIDNYSRYTWLYLLHDRSELLRVFRDFKQMIKTQFNSTIKIFRSDNAMEYTSVSFLNTLKEDDTLSHRSCPYTSQQNGRAERKHLHILNTVRSLLISAQLPESFWGEAALTAVHTINRVPSPTTSNQTPYELLHGKVPNYSLLKIFGCACFVLLPPHERTKLEPRSRLCCFLGYGIEHKGYQCYDPITQRLRVSRHVQFWEHKFFTSMSPFPNTSSSLSSIFFYSSIDISFDSDVGVDSSLSDHSAPVPSESGTSPDPVITPDSTPTPDIRRTTRVRAPPSHLNDFHCFSAIATLHEPHSYREASSDPLWQKAMSDELQALHKTGT